MRLIRPDQVGRKRPGKCPSPAAAPHWQAVANILVIWGLATLGWQAGEGPMRGALGGQGYRVLHVVPCRSAARVALGQSLLVPS